MASAGYPRAKKPLVVPPTPSAAWSVDFTADALWNGRRFRTFNVLDDFNREALHIEIDTSLPTRRSSRAIMSPRRASHS